jgi:hypothetical protein
MARALFIICAALLTACGSSSGPSAPGAANVIANGDVRLAYSLDLPAGSGPFPAIVAGHGSGRVTRQQMEGSAARWTAMGFAVLRFDKRGVGESTGVYSEVGAQASPRMIPLLARAISPPGRVFCEDDRRSTRDAWA